MAVTLNYLAGSTNVRATIDATVAFDLAAKWPDGTTFDLSGYTIEAPFLSRYGAVPPLDAVSWSVLPAEASMTLSITREQTVALAVDGRPALWGWCVWITDADERIEFARGDLLLVPA